LVRFIHAADIHLDSPLRGLNRYEGAPVDEVRMATRRALENLVTLAIDERVDFVLIAGDVFDGDWQDMNTGFVFVRQMGKLRDCGIPVFTVSGNHDAANKMTRELPYPDNVYILDTQKCETRRLEDLGVAIHGQGYRDQKETRNLALQYCPPTPGFLNIALLHTCLDGRDGHERYAPCQLSELVTRDYDYWALGHVHQRESINGGERPYVAFSGNIQGRSIRESGAKGCLLVEADPSGSVQVEFRPLDVMRWEKLPIDCAPAEHRDDVLATVSSQLEHTVSQSDGRAIAARIQLRGNCAIHGELLADDQAFRDEVRACALHRGDNKIWVERVEVLTSPSSLSVEDTALAGDAISELATVAREVRSRPELLQSLLDVEAVKHLSNHLPPELRQGEAAIRLTDPAWTASLLDRAQSILFHSARAKDATHS